MTDTTISNLPMSTTTEDSISSTPIIPNVSNLPSTVESSTPEVRPLPPTPVVQPTVESTPQNSIIKNKYNAFMDTNKSFIRKIFDNTRLNPYQCKPDGLLCDPVIIYIILMTVALIFLYIFRYQLKSKLRVGFDMILISIIFTAGLLIITNLCLYKKPSKYSIPIIVIALFALYFVMV